MEDCYLAVFQCVAKKFLTLLQEDIHRCIEENKDSIYEETCQYAVHLRKIAPSLETSIREKEFEDLKELSVCVHHTKTPYDKSTHSYST